MKYAVSVVLSDIVAIRANVSKALGYPRLAVAVGGGYHLPPVYTVHAMHVLDSSDGQFATGIPEVEDVSSAVLSAIEEGLTGTQLAAVAKAAALPDVFSDIVSDAVKEN